MFTTLKNALDRARAERYAVPAFDCTEDIMVRTILETAELYLCVRGTGYMAMKTRDGECVLEPMYRNRMVYVPPYWAHRSINTGDEPLISFCAYQADAGHNYGDIETEGFPKRVFIRDGKEIVQ